MAGEYLEVPREEFSTALGTPDSSSMLEGNFWSGGGLAFFSFFNISSLCIWKYIEVSLHCFGLLELMVVIGLFLLLGVGLLMLVAFPISLSMK